MNGDRSVEFSEPFQNRSLQQFLATFWPYISMENTNTSYLTQTLLHLMTPCLSLLAYSVNSVHLKKKKKKGDISTAPHGLSCLSVYKFNNINK